MKKKFFIGFSIAVFIFLIFFIFKFKVNKNGNNIINQDEVKNIFNMQEYEAEVEVTVVSNKNENKYKMKQQYIKSEKSVQEVLEPESIKGVKITRQGNKITLENTELNLNTIFNGCSEIIENDMDLDSFITDFKENEKESKKQENDEEIVLNTVSKNNNKYVKNKQLYINKKTGKPTRMEVKDINKKSTIYIIYNMVEIK